MRNYHPKRKKNDNKVQIDIDKQNCIFLYGPTRSNARKIKTN